MSDVQAAAERLNDVRNHYYLDDVVFCDECLSRIRDKSDARKLMSDAIDVARAYRAEHDPTPIDEEWLRSVGGIPPMEEGGVMFRPYWHGEGRGFDLDIHTNSDVVYSRRMRHIKTRGDLRRLAAALGIELKE